ncbi:MAG: RHS repeat-associated core domain-containing protein [Bacteroidaceae bacterium]|nr:RHS repeat-associated core domain-containing protein [Bacteroidaceae bacterium]
MRKRHFADHIAYVQPYKFGGKELDRMYGYDLYDFGARNYDPAIARFTGMDPLSEKYYHLSPYAYCANNPVNYIDPDGRAWKPTFTINRDGSQLNNGYEWIDESESYDSNGNLLSGLYHQAIFFSENRTFNPEKDKNINTSTATVYLADGTIRTFDACTYPSDLRAYPTIPEGMYEAKVGDHHGSKSSYHALKMFDIGKGLTRNTIELGFTNPAYSDNRTYAKGIDIHKAGSNNLTKGKAPISAGCLLIDRTRWDEFIGLFNNELQKNNTVSISLSRTLSEPINATRLPSFNFYLNGLSSNYLNAR